MAQKGLCAYLCIRARERGRETQRGGCVVGWLRVRVHAWYACEQTKLQRFQDTVCVFTYCYVRPVLTITYFLFRLEMHQNQYIADKIDSRSEMPAKPIITPENLQEVGHCKKKISPSPHCVWHEVTSRNGNSRGTKGSDHKLCTKVWPSGPAGSFLFVFVVVSGRLFFFIMVCPYDIHQQS